MKKTIKSIILAMLSAGCFALPVMGEGIASVQYLSPENLKTLPRHKLSISCTPDPKDPSLLNVQMHFRIDPGHKLYGVNIYMGGPNSAEAAVGERFTGELSIEGDRCSFTVSRKSLEKIELGYRVNENSYSMHFFSVKGTALPKLAAISDSPEADATTKTPNPAQQDGGGQPSTQSRQAKE